MQNKALVVLTASVLLCATQAQAQKFFKPIKPTTLAGEVPSAFSHTVPISLVRTDVLGRKVVAAQVTLQNAAYVSSAVLFSRVKAAQGLNVLPAAEVKALETKFNQLDLAVQSTASVHTGYVGALWNTTPAVGPLTLTDANVQQMTQVLDIQRYMQLNDNEFPHVFSISQGGWLLSTNCLTTSEGNRAFMNVVELLVKEQAGQANAVVIEHLVNLHANALNQVPLQQVVEQLKSWRVAANNPTGAPKLPMDMSGVSLRSNVENLWLAAEIRLLQLTPDIELPEILQTAQVTR